MPRVESIRVNWEARRAPWWASALASARALFSSHASKPLGGFQLALRGLPTTLALALAFGLACWRGSGLALQRHIAQAGIHLAPRFYDRHWHWSWHCHRVLLHLCAALRLRGSCGRPRVQDDAWPIALADASLAGRINEKIWYRSVPCACNEVPPSSGSRLWGSCEAKAPTQSLRFGGQSIHAHLQLDQALDGFKAA